MKRLFLIIGLIFALTSSAFAVGTASVTGAERINVLGEQQRVVLTITWTDDTAGTTLAINPVTYKVEGFYLISSETLSGTTAPTSGYTININTASGGILFTMTGSDSKTVSVITDYQHVNPVNGTLTFSLSGNSVSGATGICKLSFTAN